MISETNRPAHWYGIFRFEFNLSGALGNVEDHIGSTAH